VWVVGNNKLQDTEPGNKNRPAFFQTFKLQNFELVLRLHLTSKEDIIVN
jgi:hypothetical protein